MRVKIFRWKAISVLILVLGILAVLVLVLAEPVVEETSEQAGTQFLGTQVDIGSLNLRPKDATVDLGKLEIADPFAPMRNLIEADAIHLKLNPAALAEKKLVIERLSLRSMRFGTTRSRAAKEVKGDGFAPRLLRQMRQWSEQFDVPVLQLTKLDTVRQLALDPSQLGTVREAKALAARTGSIRQALEQGFKGLEIEETLDSASGVVKRVSSTNPANLGLDGTRRAIEDVNRALKQIDGAKKRLETLRGNVEGGVALLGRGVELVDEARQADYRFAKSLLKLPSFDAPDISGAFFGKVSIDRFKQAVYWAELARKHMPPGLLSRQEAGPDRLRRAGSTIRFPRERSYPSFLLQAGDLDFSVAGKTLLAGAYSATVRGLTSEPALYGRPATFSLRRTSQGSALASLKVDAVVNHLTQRLRDSVNAAARGLRLPAFDLPGIPFRVDPGVGNSALSFVMQGDQLSGRWNVASNQVSWLADTASRRLNQIEETVWRVVSGLNDLNITADLGGTMSHPRLSLRSNIDQAISARLNAIIGEEVRRAEQKVRAEVDRLVDAQVEPIKREVAAVQTQMRQRIDAERMRLEEVQKQLDTELKRLTGGLAPGIKLPKIKL